MPIELVQAPEKQPFPYAASVFYFPLQKWAEIIRTNLTNYYDARVASSDDLSKEISSIDLGKPALRTFLALFCDKPEFEDEGSAVRFLSRVTSRDDPKILSKLLDWTKTIHSELSKLWNVTTIYHHTAVDLNRALVPFIQHCDYPEIEGSHWNALSGFLC